MAYAHRQFQLDIIQYLCSALHAEYILHVLVVLVVRVVLVVPVVLVVLVVLAVLVSADTSMPWR